MIRKFSDNNLVEEIKDLFYIINDVGYTTQIVKRSDKFYILIRWIDVNDITIPIGGAWDSVETKFKNLKETDFFKEFYDRVSEVCKMYSYNIYSDRYYIIISPMSELQKRRSKKKEI